MSQMFYVESKTKAFKNYFGLTVTWKQKNQKEQKKQ